MNSIANIDSNQTRKPSRWAARAALLLLFLMTTVLSACGKQLEDWTTLGRNLPGTLPQSPTSPSIATATEFTSGSKPYSQTSPRGYSTSAAVGSMNQETVQISPRGYKVYSSVQGVLLSLDAN